MHVHSPFVRKCARAHIRLAADQIQIRDLIHIPAHFRQMLNRSRPQTFQPILELQIRHQRDQIHIAAVLPNPIDRPLHMLGPGRNRRQRIGHRHPRIVVRMNADLRRGLLPHIGRRRRNQFRHRSAVGITQNQNRRAALLRCQQRANRIFRIGLPCIEEMLGIPHHVPSRAAHQLHRIGNHRQIFFRRDAQDRLGLKFRRFPHKRHHRRLGLDQRPHSRILISPHPAPPRHPKGRHPRVLQLQLSNILKKRHILRIGNRESPLDVIHPQLIELRRHQQLVLKREAKPLPLRPIAQRRVVNLDSPWLIHVRPSLRLPHLH